MPTSQSLSLRKLLLGSLLVLASLAGAAANAQTVIFHEDFGNSANRVSSPYVPRANPSADPGYYTSRASGAVTDGTYTIMRPQNVNSSTASSYWRDLAQDHTFELTGQTGGALMVLNVGSGLDSFYQRNFDVQPGGSYRISVWRYTVNNNLRNGQPISWSLRLQEVNSGTDIINSGNINSQARFVWEESVYEFSIPPTCVPPPGGIQTKLSLRNESPVTNGNDIYIDDISVTQIAYDPTLPPACPVERSAVIADDDSTTTPFNTPVTLTVKGNDSTSAGVLGNPVITTPPTQGTALVNPDGTVTYTPPTGFTGEVTFEYEICNGETPQACDRAVVTVTVTADPVVPPVQAATPVPAMGFGALVALSGVIGAVGISRRRKKNS